MPFLSAGDNIRVSALDLVLWAANVLSQESYIKYQIHKSSTKTVCENETQSRSAKREKKPQQFSRKKSELTDLLRLDISIDHG